MERGKPRRVNVGSLREGQLFEMRGTPWVVLEVHEASLIVWSIERAKGASLGRRQRLVVRLLG